METIGTILLIFAICIAIMSMPSKSSYCAPYPTWSQNVEYQFRQIGRFSIERLPYLSVLISIIAPFLMISAYSAEILEKETATMGVASTTAIGVLSSSILFWKRYSDLPRPKGLAIIFEISVAVASFIFFSIGKSIADEEIHILIELSPEEFSTASSLLAGIFSMWLWTILLSLLLLAFALLHSFSIFFSLLRDTNQRAAAVTWSGHVVSIMEGEGVQVDGSKGGAEHERSISGADFDKDVLMMTGLFLASLFSISIVTSGWNVDNLRSAVPMTVLTTSFFTPTQNLKKCMEPGYTAIRIIGDGDRAVLSNGKNFKVVPCDPYQSPSHGETPQ